MLTRDRQITAAILILGGGGLVLLSQAASQSAPRGNLLASFALPLTGIILFLAGVTTVQRQDMPELISRPLQKISIWLNIELWQSVVVILSIVASLLVPIAAGTNARMNNPTVAVAAWILATGGMLVGCRKAPFRLTRPDWKSLIIPAGLFLYAFLVRGLFTDSIPIYLTGDEGSAGIDATLFVDGTKNNIFNLGWFGFPSLYFFIQSISLTFLGQTTQALRIPSAIVGALTVVGLYYTGSVMFNRRTGLIAALFLGALHLHVHFSRIGLNNIWDGLWFVLVLGAFIHGWERENRNSLLAAGLFLGLSQYFYPTSRTLFLLIAAWLGLTIIVQREKFRAVLPHLVPMLLVSFAVYFPLAWYSINHWSDYLAPMQRVTILGKWMANEIQITGQSAWLILLKQFYISLEGYVSRPLLAWYQPGVPLLRAVPSSIFLLGCSLLIIRLKETRSVVLILWLLVFGLIIGLSESAPASQRFVAAAPASALVLAYGLSGSIEYLEKLWPVWKRLSSILLIGAVILLAADDLRFYFINYTPKSSQDLARSNTMVAQVLANILSDRDPRTEVVFFGSPRMGYYSISSTVYLNPEVKAVDINQPWGSPDNPMPSSNQLLFVFLPDHYDQIPLVQADYPGGSLSEIIARDGQTLFTAYDYTRGQP